MKKEALKRILNFLLENEGKKPEMYGSIAWKIIFNEPIKKEELNVEGLYVNYLDITSLPEGLKVGGDLLLWGTPITSLPEGLTVGGDLDLSETPITSLPEGLKVGGQLWLIGCDNLTSLPKGLEVGEELHLSSDFLLRSHSDDELREMIKPGFIKGEIYR